MAIAGRFQAVPHRAGWWLVLLFGGSLHLCAGSARSQPPPGALPPRMQPTDASTYYGANSDQLPPPSQVRPPLVSGAFAKGAAAEPLPDGPANALEARLRELEEQFDEQRFQMEVLRQQLTDEREAREAATQAAAAEKAAAQAAAQKGYTVGSDPRMNGAWQNGMTFGSPNRDFWFHVGGRTQLDFVGLQAPGNSLAGAGGVGAQDAVDFRRARIRVEGTMYEVIDWCCEYNFVGAANLSTPNPATIGSVADVPAPTDLWWNFRRVPLIGNFTMGNIKEPFGLEHLTSSRFLNFMERSFSQDAFIAPSNNGFAPGLLVWNYAENRRMTWAAGLFKNVLFNPFAFGVGDGDYAADGRVTFAPYYDEASNGRYVWHVGLGGSYRANQGNQMRFRARGDLRNGPDALNPVWADTGIYRSANEAIIDPETLLIWGPWYVQAEYTRVWATQSYNGNVPIGTTSYSGYYVEVLYFLTGEHRIYDYQKGLVGRVIPFENAAVVRGANGRPMFLSGAWQIGVRYNYLDLNSKTINGGQLRDVVLGLNWFLNPNMKLQWNVTLAHRDGQNNSAHGDIYGFGMRVAHDF
ncbi:MAG TPA: porin [Pirellulales bacterium]